MWTQCSLLLCARNSARYIFQPAQWGGLGRAGKLVKKRGRFVWMVTVFWRMSNQKRSKKWLQEEEISTMLNNSVYGYVGSRWWCDDSNGICKSERSVTRHVSMKTWSSDGVHRSSADDLKWASHGRSIEVCWRGTGEGEERCAGEERGDGSLWLLGETNVIGESRRKRAGK